MKEFIEYWDEVIREWAQGDSSKDKIKCSEKVWFEKTETNLISKYMPEPYGGNPDKCSAVVINYNPGGSDIIDENAYGHISQVKIEGSMPNIMSPCYSKITLDFPWFNKEDERPSFMNDQRLKRTRQWLENRKKWVDSLMDNLVGSNEKLNPFFIDICGWHSKNWKRVKFKADSPLVDYLKKYILPVLIYTIPKSQLGIGLCVGKQFAEVILPLLGFKAVISPIKPIESKHRYFQTFDKDGVKILCTWSWGSNRRPSDKFLPFEKEMISKLIKS